jgi:hypothetical protein
MRIWRDTRGGSDGPVNLCWMTHEDYLRTDKAQHWREAMDREMGTLMEFGTWKLVDLPPGRKAIGCKWHLVQKTNDDGSKGEYKARLVAKGYRQVEGVDFFDSFSPVARIQGIHLLMTIAADLGLDIRHLDIKAAYLNGYMEELIYMQQPPGYESGDSRVCQLIRGLYGTKQAGRIWNKDLHKTLIDAGFKRLIHDQCLYIKGDIGDKENFVLLAIYVDDILLFNHPEGKAAADAVVATLQGKYTVKDMGSAKRYIGIQMTRDLELGKMTLSQEPMINDILERFQMTDCKEISTPMEEGLDLNDPEGEETGKPYRSLVGSLMYLSTCTRPDISYSVSKLSRYLSRPTELHWKAGMRLLRYLKGTKDLKLIYTSGNENVMEAFTDSDWASDPKTGKSVGGYALFRNGKLFAWKSNTQKTVAMSTTVAELNAMHIGAIELEWCMGVLNEVGMMPEQLEWYGDNQAALRTITSEKNVDKTRHVMTKIHHLREHMERFNTTPKYLRTEEMKADIFTKALSRISFERHREGLGLHYE